MDISCSKEAAGHYSGSPQSCRGTSDCDPAMAGSKRLYNLAFFCYKAQPCLQANVHFVLSHYSIPHPSVSNGASFIGVQYHIALLRDHWVSMDWRQESSVRVQILPHITQLPEWFLKPLGYEVIAVAQVDFVVVVVGLGFLIYNSCVFLISSNMFSSSEFSKGNNVLAEALGNCWLKFCCQHDECFRIISCTGRSAHLWVWSKLPMCIYCAYLRHT